MAGNHQADQLVPIRSEDVRIDPFVRRFLADGFVAIVFLMLRSDLVASCVFFCGNRVQKTPHLGVLAGPYSL